MTLFRVTPARLQMEVDLSGLEFTNAKYGISPSNLEGEIPAEAVGLEAYQGCKISYYRQTSKVNFQRDLSSYEGIITKAKLADNTPLEYAVINVILFDENANQSDVDKAVKHFTSQNRVKGFDLFNDIYDTEDGDY